MLRLDWNSEESLQVVQEKLYKGELVLGPTDTVIGLLASVSEEGYRALNSIKKRYEKPYIVLLGSIRQVATFIEPLQYFQLEKFLKKCWPGPVTIVFKARAALPSYVQAHNGTIALRIPKHVALQALLAQTGPLFSTSANITGHPVPLTIDEVEEEVLQKVYAIMVDNVQQNQGVRPSTIIDLTTVQMRVIREGMFSTVQLEQLYKVTTVE